jgi:integrase
MVCALACLRTTEALRLKENAIDWLAGRIQITGEMKNEQSQRIIPVIPAVLEALREAIDTGPRDVRGLIFVTSQANPWKPSSRTKLPQNLLQALAQSQVRTTAMRAIR